MQQTIDPIHHAYLQSEFDRLCVMVFSAPEQVLSTFSLEAGLPESIRITSSAHEVVFQARTSGDLTAAVYHFFEQCGMHFGFSEEMFCRNEKLLSPPSLYLEMTPSMKQRGIRMHLNFVQDQSFFTEAEFASYIDRLAAMKFNYLLFHMYNHQEWYPFTYRGMRHLSQKLGNLEGQFLPDDMIGREKIKTEHIWYPAELEPIEDPEKLLEAVHARYLRMMERAKSRGMTVAASIEPEDISEAFEQRVSEWSQQDEQRDMGFNLSSDWQQGWSGKKIAEVDTRNPILLDLAVERCLQLYAAYPCLDELHLISREGTSFLAEDTDAYRAELARLGRSLEIDFSEDFLMQLEQVNTDDPAINPKAYPYWTVLPGQNQYATFIGAMRYLEFALNILRDERMQALAQRISLAVSLYSPNPNTIRLVSQYVGKIIPAGVRFDILGDYGARDIANQMDDWGELLLQKKDIGVISWLEFDGNMDLAQSWTHAVYDNVAKAAQMGISTIYFNHWRVRGLEQTAKVAADACFDRNTGYAGIMNRYAVDTFGDRNTVLLRKAAETLEQATEHCKKRLYNVGFTGDWVYRFATDPPGYREEDLELARALFEKAGSDALALAASCEPRGAREAVYLAMLCSISKTHLHMVSQLQRVKHEMIRLFIWPPEDEARVLPKTEKLEELLATANSSLAFAQTYMSTYADFVETCDEQGELAHYELGVVLPLKRLVLRLEYWVKSAATRD